MTYDKSHLDKLDQQARSGQQSSTGSSSTLGMNKQGQKGGQAVQQSGKGLKHLPDELNKKEQSAHAKGHTHKWEVQKY